ncbi:spike base protein, RCAP_Rcc01079 family [Halobacillus ihumii]|uniref:spike base protein, RCAP_Rcc01079 family n=1 Tax=Halobacillus ihumii TaxID=2686092 RepID=UPI0013D179E4|nr:hypothetical protein [Halobacillus ihumii]
MFSRMKLMTKSLGHNFELVVPNDETDLKQDISGFLVGTGGKLNIMNSNGQDVILNVTEGVVYPLNAKRILETGTTAQGIVILY